MIDFTCDGCQQVLQIGDEWAGKLGHCPRCGTDSRVPGNPKRTSKLVIAFRMAIIPFLVVAFWGLMLSIAAPVLGLILVLGGVGAIVFGLCFCWGFTNICTFFYSPRYYRLWKKGGGDPFFDTLSGPFNNDPPATRYQEMYREKARQEGEAFNRTFGLRPPVAPDASKGIDDPNVI